MFCDFLLSKEVGFSSCEMIGRSYNPAKGIYFHIFDLLFKKWKSSNVLSLCKILNICIMEIFSPTIALQLSSDYFNCLLKVELTIWSGVTLQIKFD